MASEGRAKPACGAGEFMIGVRVEKREARAAAAFFCAAKRAWSAHGARTFLSASRAGARTVADKNVRAPRTDAGKNARAPLNIATAARALLLSTLIRLSFSHTSSAGGLRSSLARHACSAALLLSSLTWGQDGTEPKDAAPDGRGVVGRRPAGDRVVVPTAAPIHTVRARRRTPWVSLRTTRV